jgi:hypothetical protein
VLPLKSQSKTLRTVSRGKHSVPRVLNYLANLQLKSWFIFDEQDGLAIITEADRE